MKPVVSVGKQNFLSLRTGKYFYIDKTNFIKEWWESGDDVTLITRPRRFGKTLNMSMMECFFSNKYEDRGDLFEGLSVWEDEKYRKLQGTYPVIFLSFADIKQQNYEDAIRSIKGIISNLYNEHFYLSEWEGLTQNEKKQFVSVSGEMDDVTAQTSVKNLCNYLSRYYQKKVIVLLDEYDTPMQEAYLGGYWDQFTQFIRSMFNSTFKTNPYLERAIMTGITLIKVDAPSSLGSKIPRQVNEVGFPTRLENTSPSSQCQSIFSDLNNLRVVTTTCDEYATSFGFTEQEVFVALDQFELGEMKQDVKPWYDGFTFGKYTDIYNPWSITYFLKEKKLASYWASSSSNGLVNSLLQQSSPETKCNMERLLKGECITVMIDEQIVFNQLDEDEDAIWSLLLASGYLKVEHLRTEDADGDILDEPEYTLKLTNREVRSMFIRMMKGWFKKTSSYYNYFIKALLKGNLKEMNAYMNEVALATFSTFDTGKQPSMRSQSERFYHGFVLGLLVELRGDYEVISNSESGLGRYDVMICPLKPDLPAYVLEFKVIDDTEEKTLEDTVKAAHKQIEEMKYDTRLLERGIQKEQIRHYGFAFEGKKVLIG